MAMPKASMNKNGFTAANKCYVRLTGKFFAMQAIATGTDFTQHCSDN